MLVHINVEESYFKNIFNTEKMKSKILILGLDEYNDIQNT